MSIWSVAAVGLFGCGLLCLSWLFPSWPVTAGLLCLAWPLSNWVVTAVAAVFGGLACVQLECGCCGSLAVGCCVCLGCFPVGL